MRNNLSKYWFVFAFLFIFALSYLGKNAAIDWRETFSADDKIPYGTFLLYEELEDHFDEQGFRKNERPFSEWLDEAYSNKNLILISDEIHFGEVDQRLILDFVSRGNTLFIASDNIHPDFYNAIELWQDINFKWTEDTVSSMQLVNPNLSKEQAHFTHITDYAELKLNSSFGGDVLGIRLPSKAPNFVRIPYGNGTILLHLNPRVFSNIHLLEAPIYSQECFSYLPLQETFWDEYYKPYHRKDENAFQLLKKSKALNYAWTLLIAGSILGIIFFAKRKQRAIPVILPPENKTLEFIENIGDLYFQEGNHHDLIRKKIRYFYHNISLMYMLHENEPDFWVKLQQKSGAKEKTVRKLKDMILAFHNLKGVSRDFLLVLNGHLEDFYAQSGKYPSHE